MCVNIKDMLLREYDIHATAIRETTGGWSASAYKVRAEEGDFFLKVYDKHRHSTRGWLARIDNYMPGVLWLYGNTDLRENMVAPVPSKNGSHQFESEDYLYILFPFLAGKPVDGMKMSPEQLRELARIVAELHGCDTDSRPVELCRETFDVSFCDTLCDRLGERGGSDELSELLSSYSRTMRRSVEMLRETASLLMKSDHPFVLCHTDIHAGNLIYGEKWILINWEGLKLAPVEADLFAFTQGFFFGNGWHEFIACYQAVRKGYRPNPQALSYYRLRRRLEDIFEFVESLLFDDLERRNRDHSIRNLLGECSRLSELLLETEQ